MHKMKIMAKWITFYSSRNQRCFRNRPVNTYQFFTALALCGLKGFYFLFFSDLDSSDFLCISVSRVFCSWTSYSLCIRRQNSGIIFLFCVCIVCLWFRVPMCTWQMTWKISNGTSWKHSNYEIMWQNQNKNKSFLAFSTYVKCRTIYVIIWWRK